MSPQQIDALRERRRALAQQLEELRASDKVLRHASGPSARRGHPTSWRQAVRSIEEVIAQIDKVLAPLDLAKPTRRVRAGQDPRAPVGNEVLVVLARMPNTPRSETRVSVRQGDGRAHIDVRVWRLVDGGDAVPTLKGVSIDPDQLPVLLAALQSAGQYTAPAQGQG